MKGNYTQIEDLRGKKVAVEAGVVDDFLLWFWDFSFTRKRECLAMMSKLLT